MLKKAVCIALSALFLLSSTSCSSNNKKSSSAKKSVDESASKCLSRIIVYNGDLNAPNDVTNDYQLSINIYSKDSTYTFSSPKTSCEFSKEKGDEFFNKFQQFDMKEYEPYHANEDGVMVKKYEPFTVQTFYILKTVDGEYKVDQTENTSGHFFMLSEANYNNLLNDFKELEKLAQKSKNS